MATNRDEYLLDRLDKLLLQRDILTKEYLMVKDALQKILDYEDDVPVTGTYGAEVYAYARKVIEQSVIEHVVRNEQKQSVS